MAVPAAVLGSVIAIGERLINRLIPDKEKAREAEVQFLRDAMDGELKQIIAQLEINAREAAHPSIWVAGWRPFFGWVGGAAFAYSVIVQPILTWWALAHGLSTPPDVQSDLLWVVITGMLGIGGLRTYEKRSGVTK
jgi:hypothetical protein